MPWTASEFKARHWNDATPAQAARASHIANTILARGADEGVAIATAIKRTKQERRGK